MPYTHVWDNTAPVDSSFAKLLGQVVRNLKVDIQERLGLYLSGTLAARPAPEASWVGLLYFCIDDGLIYRWDGAAWGVLTSTGGAYSNTDGTAFPGIGDFDIDLVTLPANSLRVGSVITIDGVITADQGVAATSTVTLYFGVSSLVTITPNGSSDLMFHAVVVVTGAATQVGWGYCYNALFSNVTNFNAAPVSPAEAIAGAIPVKMRTHQTNVGDSSIGRLLTVVVR